MSYWNEVDVQETSCFNFLGKKYFFLGDEKLFPMISMKLEVPPLRIRPRIVTAVKSEDESLNRDASHPPAAVAASRDYEEAFAFKRAPKLLRAALNSVGFLLDDFQGFSSSKKSTAV